MRAAPAFQVSLRRFAIWRAAVLTLYVLGAAATLAWLVTRERPVAWGLVAMALLALAALAVAARALWRIAPADLRWDGLVWHLARPNRDALQGTLSVAIDLGSWMLLRFAPSSGTGARATAAIWLPVQRRGIEAQWHALRCAVHSPHPVARDDSAT
jgi:hypothetical protein